MATLPGDSAGPSRGDVVSIESGEAAASGEPSSGPLGLGPMPGPDDRVRLRLHGFPATFTVRVGAALPSAPRSGPRLTELTITADDGGAVDVETLRAVPVRRLALSAAAWIERCGGQVMFVGDTAETFTRPDDADPKVYEAARIAGEAMALGKPVRPTVAARLHVSKTTVDRLLKRARAEGWLDADPLPKRPQPQQIDHTTETRESDQ